MEKENKVSAPLRQVLKKLGGQGAIIKATLARLQRENVKASASLVYKTIAGTAHRPEIETAFLAEAETEFARRRDVAQRASQLVAEA